MNKKIKYHGLNTTLVYNLKKKIQELKESEERFKAIFESAPDTIYLQNLDGTFIDANKAAEKLTGYKRKELIGKDIKTLKIFPPEELKKIIKDLGKPSDKLEEYTLIKKDGAKIIVESISQLINLNGEKVILGIARDITEKKKIQAELLKFRTVIDNANFGIGIADLKGNLIYSNSYFARVHGYQPEEIVGKSLKNFHNKEQLKKVMEINKNLFKKGTYEAEEIWHTHKDGRVFPMLMSGILIKDQNKKPLFIAATAIDITAKKKAEEKLSYFKKAVEQSSEAIGMSTPEGKHYYQNKAFDDLFGNIGNNPPASVYVNKKIGKKVFQTIMNGSEWKGEVEMYGKDKKKLTILLHAYPIKNKNGKITGLVGAHNNITEPKKLEHDLKKRVKELNAFYKLGEIVEKPGATLKDIGCGLVNLIPAALQYPELACARITGQHDQCQTPNFKKTKWGISTKVGPYAKIEVCYLKKKKFLKEEKKMLDGLAGRFKRIIERYKAQEKVKNKKMI